MFGLTKLHDLAAARGEGLRTEILDLLVSRGSVNARNVEDLASHRRDGFNQAGPNPLAGIVGALPEGVVQFPLGEPGDRRKRQRRAV